MTLRWADPDRPEVADARGLTSSEITYVAQAMVGRGVTLLLMEDPEADPRWHACPVCGLGPIRPTLDGLPGEGLTGEVRGWPAHPLCVEAARRPADVEPRHARRMPGHSRLFLAGVAAVTLLLLLRGEWSAALAVAGTTVFLILVGLIPEPPTTTGRIRR